VRDTAAHNATSEEAQEIMRSFAAQRGLHYEAAGLLPPVSNHLQQGHGQGAHRAGRPAAGGWFTDGFTLRPERFSENLCTGALPGGAEGTIAHHGHLVLSGSGGDPPQSSWQVSASTVVLIEMPELARVTRRMTIKTRGYAGTTKVISLRAPRLIGPRRYVPLDPAPELHDRYEIEGHVADAARLSSLFDAEVVQAMLAAPKLLVAEARPGILELHLPGYQVDPEALEALCRLGSALAGRVLQVAEQLPRLDPAMQLPAPADTEEQRWLDGNVPEVEWPVAPPDAPAAVAAYRDTAARDESLHAVLGQRTAGDSISRVTFLVLAVVFGLSAAVMVGVLVAVGVAALAGLGAAVAAGVVAGPLAGTLTGFGFIRLGKRTRARRQLSVSEHVIGRFAARLGLEAFAREYARARGMTLEDPDELRARLACPLPGIPVKAIHGDLGDGVVGRLAFWLDDTDVTRATLYNVAVVAANGSTRDPSSGYEAFAADGCLLLAQRVDALGRSAARLDELRSEVVRITGARR
jgi:hypothetical protein